MRRARRRLRLGLDSVSGACCQRVVGAKLLDRLSQACVEFVGLADGHAGGGDGVPDTQSDVARVEVAGVDGQEIVDATERDGDEWHLGADREEGGPGEKRLDGSVGGAGTFRKDKEGHTVAKRANSGAEAGDRCVGVDGVDRNLAGAVEMPADERHRPELFLGENAELEGQRGEDNRRVHVGRVIGRVYSHRMLAEVFGTANDEPRARNAYAPLCPKVRDPMLQLAAFIP